MFCDRLKQMILLEALESSRITLKYSVRILFKNDNAVRGTEMFQKLSVSIMTGDRSRCKLVV